MGEVVRKPNSNHLKRLVLISVTLLGMTLLFTDPAFPAAKKGRGLVLIANGGFSRISKSAELFHPSGSGIMLGAAFGYEFSPALGVLIEYEVHHLNDEDPSEVVWGWNDRGYYEVVYWPKILKTSYILLSPQLKVKGFHIRPAIGFGGHSFAALEYANYPDYPPGVLGEGRVSSEGSPAVGLTLGYTRPLRGKLGWGAEGYWRHSWGEDSTAARTVIGIRLLLSWDL